MTPSPKSSLASNSKTELKPQNQARSPHDQKTSNTRFDNNSGSVGTVSTANRTYTSAAGNTIAKIEVEVVTFSTAATDANDATRKKEKNTALAAAINASSEMKARGITATVAADAAGLMTLAFAEGSALHMDDQAHAKVATGLNCDVGPSQCG